MALVSEEYIGPSMFNWIEEELGLADLAELLRGMKEKDTTDLTDLLTAILTYKEYYTIQEVKDFILQMERMKSLSRPQFRKMQGDGFLRYHKYLKAAAIYDEILDQNGDLNQDEFLGSIYHNKAVALAYNFELEEAGECFLKAYGMNGKRQSILGYLLLQATMRPREDVEILAKYYDVEDLVLIIYDTIEDAEADVIGSPVYHRMQKAMYHYEKNNLTDFNKRMDTVIEKLKEEFREQTV
jgi:tetratricopeptide (TPR) repeat protein